MVADLPFACQANVPQKLCHSTLHEVCSNLRLTRGQLTLLIRQQSQCVHLLVNPSASARGGAPPGAVPVLTSTHTSLGDSGQATGMPDGREASPGQRRNL